MSIVVRLSPTNVTRDKYDEVASRLESAGMWPNPDGLDYTFSSGQRETSASARSGILESSSRRSESTSCPSSPTLESGSPPNRRYSRFTTSPSARNALLGPQIARWGCEPGNTSIASSGWRQPQGRGSGRRRLPDDVHALLDITVVVVALPSMQQRLMPA